MTGPAPAAFGQQVAPLQFLEIRAVVLPAHRNLSASGMGGR